MPVAATDIQCNMALYTVIPLSMFIGLTPFASRLCLNIFTNWQYLLCVKTLDNVLLLSYLNKNPTR